MNKASHTTAHSKLNFGANANSSLCAGELRADRHKAYRRKGYRVIIDAWPREQLKWAVYRPRMHTPAATGVVTSMEDAVAGANAWIATDPHGARVT